MNSEENLNKPKSNILARIICYFAGLFIMTAGIALSVKSRLGVSPVSSVPNAITLIWGLEMGKGTILLHSAMVLLQIIILRRKFKLISLCQVLIGIVFGYFTTFCNWGVDQLWSGVVTNIWLRLGMQAVSIILIALGIFFYMPAKILPLAGEGLTMAMSEVMGIAVHKAKIIMDVSLVLISAVLGLIFIQSLGSVGIGTIMAAIFVGMVLGVFNRLFGKWRDKLYRIPVIEASVENQSDDSDSSIEK